MWKTRSSCYDRPAWVPWIRLKADCKCEHTRVFVQRRSQEKSSRLIFMRNWCEQTGREARGKPKRGQCECECCDKQRVWQVWILSTSKCCNLWSSVCCSPLCPKGGSSFHFLSLNCVCVCVCVCVFGGVHICATTCPEFPGRVTLVQVWFRGGKKNFHAVQFELGTQRFVCSAVELFLAQRGKDGCLCGCESVASPAVQRGF